MEILAVFLPFLFLLLTMRGCPLFYSNSSSLKLLIFLLLCIKWSEGQAISGQKCKQLRGSYSWEDVAQCQSLMALNWRTGGVQLAPIMGAIDIDKWMEFTDKLKWIGGVHFFIRNSTIKRIKMSNLREIHYSWITIENNPLLEEISINLVNISSISGLVITDNPKLETIRLSSSKGVLLFTDTNYSPSRIIVTGNGELKTIELAKRTGFPAVDMLKISDNLKLESISFNSIQSFKGDEINICNNPNLKKISAKNLKLLGNFSKSLKIRANRQLNQEILDKFKGLQHKTAGKIFEVQEEGECIFIRKIRDLGELKDCKYVESDLWIVPGATGDATGVRLSHVKGKIHLGSLQPDKLDFLKYAVVDVNQITSETCNFELETIPKYVNKNKCPPDVGNQKLIKSHLVVGTIAGGFGLLALIFVVFSIYWCCWRNMKAKQKRQAVEEPSTPNNMSESSGTPGRTPSTTPKTPRKSETTRKSRVGTPRSPTATSLANSSVMSVTGTGENSRTGAKKTAEPPRTPEAEKKKGQPSARKQQ